MHLLFISVEVYGGRLWQQIPGLLSRSLECECVFFVSSRIFSFLDVVTLCRCAQVSRVSARPRHRLRAQRRVLLFVCAKSVRFSLSALSPGTFWPWTAATGSASTSLTSSGTLRFVSVHCCHTFEAAVSLLASPRLSPLCWCRRAEWWRTSPSAAAAS